MSERASQIRHGIEWFATDWGEDCQCARCGSSAAFVRCANCDEDGYSHHDCGEDCCFCDEPWNNVVCDWCHGDSGWWHCISEPEWCAAHPMPGREAVTSTAMRAEAWGECDL